MSRATWGQRIARAEALAVRYPSSAAMLEFYARLAAEQERLFMLFRGERLEDVAPVLFPQLLTFLERAGNAEIAQQAAALRVQTPEQWIRLLRDPERDFIARSFLQPWAESRDDCPSCHRHPQVAVLREVADGLSRSLACALCQQEWPFERILCPVCGERGFDQLPVFRAEEFPHLRIEACDACKNYLLSVDLNTDPEAVPLVEDLAAVTLHLWARDRGYNRIQRNLLGL